jgi:WD40 repeat protein
MKKVLFGVLLIPILLAACGTPAATPEPADISSIPTVFTPMPLLGHTIYIKSLSFSPDGKLIASGSQDGTIVLWETATRQPVAQLEEDDTSTVCQVIFSPDGRWLASVGLRTVSLWDVSKARQAGASSLQPFWQSEANARSVAFSPDGKWLAWVYEHTVLLWDISAMSTSRTPAASDVGLSIDMYSVSSLTFSPDSLLLAIGNEYGVILWDVAARSPLSDLPITISEGTVKSLAFSPDGKLLAAGVTRYSTPGLVGCHVCLLDVATRQIIGQPLQGINRNASNLAFSPDGKWLVLGSIYDVQVWGVPAVLNAAQNGEAPGQGRSLEGGCAAFSPDGKLLATDSNVDILLWDAATLDPVEGAFVSARPTQPPPGDASFSGDCAAAPYDGDQDGHYESLLVKATVIIHEPATAYWVSGSVRSEDGTIITERCPNCVMPGDFHIPAGTSGPVKVELLFSGEDIWEHGVDGPYQIDLYLGSTGGYSHDSTSFTTAAYSVDHFRFYDALIESVTSFAEDSNGDSSYDALVVRVTVEVLQSGSYVLRGYFEAEDAYVHADTRRDLAAGTDEIDLRFDGRDIETAKSIDLDTVWLELCNQQAVCWYQDSPLSFEAGEIPTHWYADQRASQSQFLRGHDGQVTSIAWSPDSSMLASGSTDHSVILWDLSLRQPLIRLEGHPNSVTSVAFSPDGTTLASSGYVDIIRLWDVPTGQQMAEFTGLISAGDVVFSPDGTLLAGANGGIRLWGVDDRRPIGQPFGSRPGGTCSLAFDPNGTLLAQGGWNGPIVLWDVVTHQSVDQFFPGSDEGICSLVFTADGQTLVAGSWDGTITLWDISEHQQVGLFDVGMSAALLDLSPDGRLVAISDFIDVRLLDLETGGFVGKPLEGHDDVIDALAFSPDGRWLATGARDDTIILWDMDEVKSRLPNP